MQKPRRAGEGRNSPPTTLALASGSVPLRVRESARARRIALRIDDAAEAVELVLPRSVPLARGLAFLESRRGWLTARLARLPARIPFAEGATIPVLGAPHRIRHMGRRAAGAPVVSLAAGEIRVYGAAEHASRRVRDHLAALARRECEERAKALAATIERRVAQVSVRDTRSRWGSCSAAGSLSFSWRLVLAPGPVLDYVVAHEVAHLVEMNHGPRFWRLVERLAPGAAVQRAWLKRHRALLLRYG